MSGAALYIVGGLLLLCCLLRIFLDRDSEDEFSNPLSGGADLSNGTLPDPQLSAQLFGNEDWKYVTILGSKTIEREFLRNRKKLALSWVRTVKAEAHALIGAHRAAARASADLNFLVEIRVTIAYASFLLLCIVLNAVIQIRGPVGLQALARLADSRSEQLFEIVGQFFPVALNADDNFGGMLGRRDHHE